MLYASLVLSAILLGTIGVSLWRGQRPGGGTFVLGLGLSLGTVVLKFQFPCVLYQAILLLVAHALVSHNQLTCKSYFGLAVFVTVGVYGVVGIMTWSHLSNLREEFPYESLEARLSVRNHPVDQPKPVFDAKSLDSMEDAVAQQESSGWPFNPTRSLEALHANTTSAFVNSPGFGVARMRGGPHPETLRRQRDAEQKIFQPAPKSLELLSAISAESFRDAPNEKNLASLHHNSILDFVYPEGFGFFKDRRHVAGFRPHQFRSVPDADQRLRLETIELVGLVIHETPVAYVSDMLPSMEVLRSAPVRALDTFETMGLAELRKGSELFLRQQGVHVRMLGAIRATKQCTSCHDCERGTLLGAFSYVLNKSTR